MVSAQNVGFYRVIVFTRGGSRIGVSRVLVASGQRLDQSVRIAFQLC